LKGVEILGGGDVGKRNGVGCHGNRCGSEVGFGEKRELKKRNWVGEEEED
jgi:hypothetical protein